MKIDNRFVLILVFLIMFFAWLCLVAFWFLPKITESGQLDPMMTLIAGLGVGSVTNAFIVLITLSWQFYFRKKEKADKPEVKEKQPGE